MKKLFLIFISIVIILINSCNKFDSINGRIEGKTTNASEIVKISDVKVWVKKDTIIATTFSDSVGFYNFIEMPVGKYQIWAWKDPFDTTVYMDVNVVEGNTTIRNIKLFLIGK